MTQASKFIFGNDFRQSTQRGATNEDITKAEKNGYERGFADGRIAGDIAAAERMARAIESLAQAAGQLLAGADTTHRANERAAVEFALLFARKFGGAAIARAPVAPIAEAATACFDHLTGVPHLVARVHQDLVDETERVLSRLAHERGFEGRMIVLGEPDIAPGDVRLEWADGALSREQASIDQIITDAVAAWVADDATRR